MEDFQKAYGAHPADARYVSITTRTSHHASLWEVRVRTLCIEDPAHPLGEEVDDDVVGDGVGLQALG